MSPLRCVVGPQDGNAEKLQQSARRAQPSQPKLREPHLIASVSSRCRPLLLLSVCVSCYSSCLDLLVEHDCRSIAFCCVSTGIFGFDNTEAAVVALDTVRSWLEREDNRSAVDALVFCCFLDKDLRIYQRNMPLFFPCDAQQPEGAEAEAADGGEAAGSNSGRGGGGQDRASAEDGRGD